MSLVERPAPAYTLRHWRPGPTGPYVVSASGELDLQAAPQLRDLLIELIERGANHLVVDMTEATFIDSTAIGVLTGRLRRLHARGGSLVLVCNAPHLLRTIEIAGLGRAFEIHATLPEALARAWSR